MRTASLTVVVCLVSLLSWFCPASARAQAPEPVVSGAGDGATTPVHDDGPEPEPPRASVASGPLFRAGTDLVATSAYVWRGFVPTGVSVQPALWIKAGPVTVSSWMNLSRVVTPSAMTEHDLTIDYAVGAPGGTFSAGLIDYVFPGALADTHSDELYVGYDVAAPFAPTLRVFHDIRAGSGTYVTAGASATRALGRGWKVTPSVAVGYNHRQWIDASTWSDLTIGMKVTSPAIVGRLVVAPFVNRLQALDGQWFASRWYGGVGVGAK